MKLKTLKWELSSWGSDTTDDAIGILTLNVPDHINALGPRMALELNYMMDEIRRSEARVVVITGAGGNFCGGGDLKVELTPLECEKFNVGLEGEYGEITEWWMNDYFHKIAQEACVKLENLPQTIIAAVGGQVAGIGLELAITCDLRIATDNAQFVELAVPAGFLSEWCAPRILPQLIGQSKANEMILLGRPIMSEEAYQIGLVNKVVPLENLYDEAMGWAARLASYPKLGVRYAKENLRYYQAKNRSQEGLDMELARVLEITRTRECAEGISAFLEKRPPIYQEGRPVARPGKEYLSKS